MKIYNFDQIKKAIDINKDLDSLVNNQRQTFIDFSKNLYEIPLPIQLSFSDYQSDCHIKAGFKKGGDIFIIKSATGFYNNPAISLPSNDGAILVFSQKTGLLQTISRKYGKALSNKMLGVWQDQSMEIYFNQWWKKWSTAV